MLPGQAQKETTVNEALVAIDFLLSASVEGVASTPPAFPAPGMAWIVGAAPTGAFSGHSGHIAGRTEAGWRFIQPAEGMRTFDRAAGAFQQYTDSWAMIASPDLPAGGGVVDAEARACLAAVLAALEQIGIFSVT